MKLPITFMFHSKMFTAPGNIFQYLNVDCAPHQNCLYYVYVSLRGRKLTLNNSVRLSLNCW